MEGFTSIFAKKVPPSHFIYFITLQNPPHPFAWNFVLEKNNRAVLIQQVAKEKRDTQQKKMPENATLKLFSWDEVRRHCSDKDCWVVLYDNVLDVTKFLGEHPGGLDPICDLGGFDITNQFEAIGHSEGAVATYKKFIIGRIDRVVPPPVVQRKERPDAGVPLSEFKLQADGGLLRSLMFAGAFVCVIFAIVVVISR